MVSSCKTTQPVKSDILVSETIFSQTKDCPENGTCTLELIPNKSIDFKSDEFGNLYPVINEGTSYVLKYTFTKNPISETEDSNYTEIIYAQLPNPLSEIELINGQLQNVKLNYGRLCFCKGESGYFPVTNGVFILKKPTEDTLEITLDFSVKKIPQIISKINETLSLKSNPTN